MIRELKTVEEFREAMQRRESIVITDSAGNRFHATPWACSPHVIEDNFFTKVITNGGRNGGYFAVDSLDEAEYRWPGVTKCS
jgi:hypothetical protein